MLRRVGGEDVGKTKPKSTLEGAHSISTRDNNNTNKSRLISQGADGH
jgi:hypothetical protein